MREVTAGFPYPAHILAVKVCLFTNNMLLLAHFLEDT
jgi:hypothetical protein